MKSSYSRYLNLIVALTLFVAVAAQAQYSEKAFELKKAQELYDERGFQNGSAINVDGKLNITPGSGNVSYSYPISSTNINGYPINVELNYCGSVAMTAYKNYESQSLIFDNEGNKIGATPFIGWSKFHRNHPVWLIGVNGFAVQALAATSNFYCKPQKIGDEFTNSRYEFTPEDFIWTIDGYDVCNRMANFGILNPNHVTEGLVKSPTDVIQLLRSDGSVLSLYNHNRVNGVTSQWDHTFYTGYYHVEEPNAKGFAIVEYDTAMFAPYMQAILFQTSTFPVADAPRRVRYFPGDGIEYIFREWIMPYGTFVFTDNRIGAQGGASAGPTIFYLDEISANGRTLSPIMRSRHYPMLHQSLGEDSTKGRALCTGLNGVKFSYDRQGMTIEAHGRTTRIKFGPIVPSGDYLDNISDETGDKGVSTMMYFGYELFALSRASINDVNESFNSEVDFISEIEDPEGRKTTFTYESYKRHYKNPGFPKKEYMNNNVFVKLKNWRLKEIIEPTAKYVLNYAYGGQSITAPITLTKDSVIIHSDIVSTPDASNVYVKEAPFAHSNIIDSVRKFNLQGKLLTVDRYQYLFDTDNDQNTFIGTSTSAVHDIINNTITTSYLEYDKFLLNDYDSRLIRKKHTVVKKSEESRGAQITKTRTYYDTIGSSYLILPTLKTTWNDQIINSNYSTSANLLTEQYSYVVDTVRNYGGIDSISGKFGLDVVRKVTEYQLSQQNPKTLFVDTTDYVFLPYSRDTVILQNQLYWNKLKSMARYFYKKDTLGQTGVSWEEGLMDTAHYGVYETFDDTIDVRLSPLGPLVRQQWLSDSTGRFLTGSKYSYYTDSTQLDQTFWRGRLRTDSIIARDRMDSILKQEITYVSANSSNAGLDGTAGLPYSTINANKAVSRSYYDGGTPEQPIKGTAHDNRNGDSTLTVYPGELFASLYAKPIAEEAVIRRLKFNPTIVDTSRLTQYYDRTFFGQAEGVVDYNGFLTSIKYDRNGRLLYLWNPGDFPSRLQQYWTDYSTQHDIRTIGYTLNSYRFDTIYCNGPAAMVTEEPMEHYGELFVNKLAVDVPDCDTANPRSKKQGPSLANIAGVHPYMSVTPAVGYAHFRFNGDSIVSLSDAYVQFYASTVMGDECMQLTVQIPEISYSKTLIFNCNSEGEESGGGGGTGSRTEKSTGASFLSGNDTIKTEYIKLTLSNKLAALRNVLETSGLVTLKLSTPTIGGEMHFNSGLNGEDKAPRLVIDGTFRAFADTSDYTLAYQYNDSALTSTEFAKIDDIRHTASSPDPFALLNEKRRTSAKHYFGADYRVLRSDLPIGNPYNPVRTDSVVFDNTGLALKRKIINQIGDSVVTEFDDAGRPTKIINQDGTHSTITYRLGPPSVFGLQNAQNFYNYVSAKITKREDGVVNAEYTDGLGRLRRQIMDSVGQIPLRYVTQYEYDLLNRLTHVINPEGDTTWYWYDPFGRVRYKQQPDLGTISYAYDMVGNLRFSQTQEQADNGRMTFNQYDDLNRLTLVGEMIYLPYGQSDSTIHYGINGEGSGAKGTENGKESTLSSPVIASSDNDVANSRMAVTPILSQEQQIIPSPTTGLRFSNQPTHSEKQGQQGPSLLSANGYNDTLNLHRLTDLANPRILNTGFALPLLTWNPTVFTSPASVVPTLRHDSTVRIAFCSSLPPLASLGETTAPTPPFLKMPVTPQMFYDPRKGPGATLNNFEDAALFPHFPRIAISYDTLPQRTGAIWGNFPDYSKWETLAPKGKIRNMKGHEVAVAWREHGGEPYHYSVMSYDERGRVEALLRYSESLGFDAVYYTYNSANLVTSVRVADPFRQHTTFYGYNYNGQVDSVWTHLEGPGSGVVKFTPSMRTTTVQRPLAWNRQDSLGTADISYRYTALGNVEQMKYPQAGVMTDYWYGKRGWLDSLESQYTIVAPKIFTQKLWYDSVGRIIKQESKNGSQTSVLEQSYGYDNVDRLQKWYRLGVGDTVLYEYDKVGNRTWYAKIDGGDLRTYEYGTGSTGPNRLQKEDRQQGGSTVRTEYSYNGNGSVLDRVKRGQTIPAPVPPLWGLVGEEHFGYSYRELNWRYINGDPFSTNHSDWRYRYNAMGEREQKRLYHAPLSDSVAGSPYPWVQYILGGSKEQLAVWHGQQMTSLFCDTVKIRNVFLYPTEYITNGIGWNGVHEDITPIITRPDGSKEYRISDHLASLRVSLTNGSPTKYYDYDPWGSLLSGTPTRRMYNDREEDKENSLYNNGVRKLDDGLGRFTAIDPLWEKFRWQSPYVYGDNDPLGKTDPKGMQAAPTWKADAGGAAASNNNTWQWWQGGILREAVAAAKSSEVRKEYVTKVSGLSKTDGAARSQLKVDARAKTPAEYRAIAEAMRPSQGESGRVGGTASKTNTTVNKATEVFGTAGKVITTVQVGISVYNIATSENPGRTTAQEVGGWSGALTGGLAGAEIGLYVGSFFGPAGAVAGAFIGGVAGGVIGGICGSELGGQTYDMVTQ